MLFNYVLGIKSQDKGQKRIYQREAVRGIIFNKDKILMVHSNKGDYKFPGGGVKREESLEETLKREVQEETGFMVDNVINKIGVVIERKIDDYDKDSIFEMISYYYTCLTQDKQTIQQLDEYEAALNFKPIWISLDEAIEANEEILKNSELSKNNWLHRETLVLNSLKNLNLIKGGV